MDVLLWTLLGVTAWCAAGFGVAWALSRAIAIRDHRE